MKPGLLPSSIVIGTALIAGACKQEAANDTPAAPAAPVAAAPAKQTQPINPPGGTLKGPATYATLQPYFKEHCFKCHGARPRKAGNYDLTTYSAAISSGDDKDAIKPGDPEHSLLVEFLSRQKGWMPRGSDPLPAGDVNVISEWVKNGAKEK